MTCLWRDEFEIFHRSQTKAAERMAKEKWRQRATRPTITPDSESTTQSSSPPVTFSGHGPLPGKDSAVCAVTTPRDATISIEKTVSLRPWLEQMAQTRFFFDFVTSLECPNRSHGVLGPVPAMFEKAAPDSHFHSLVSAMSYANFGSRYNSEDALRKGAVFYGRALQGYAELMASPKETVKANELLLGIFMLSLYENLTSPAPDGVYKMHQIGAASILQARQSDSSLNHAADEPHLGTIHTTVVCIPRADQT